tara:strand:- start:33648 stop:33845 length:198 start_codon:yes stop_codon:yes gene_type:complete
LIEEMDMGRMCDLAIEMEEAAVSMIEMGASSPSDVLAGVRTAVPFCDDKYVLNYVYHIMGPDEAF